MPETVVDKIKPQLPVSFKEFSKKPVIAVLYIALLAIGGLYIDLRRTTNRQDTEKTATIDEMKKTIVSLTVSVDLLKTQLRRCDSSIADMTATLRVLKQVGKIQ